MSHILLVLFTALVLASSPAVSFAQTPKPGASTAKVQAELTELRTQVAELRAQLGALTTALAACQAQKAEAGSKGRDEALMALRAVESAIEGGADADAFKKYHLEAKVKVDGLPDIAENEPLRSVVQIYTDVSALLTASSTSMMPDSQVSYFKTQYKDSGSEAIKKLPDAGFMTERYELPARTTAEKLASIDRAEARDLGRLYARQAAQDLSAIAKKQLVALRK